MAAIAPAADDGSLIVSEPLGPLTHDATPAADGSGGIITQPLSGGGGNKPDILRTSWPSLSDIGHRFAMGARDVIEGVSGAPAGVLDLATWPARAAQRAFGLPTEAPSTLVTRALDASGLPSPQTPGEQYTSAGVRGASAMLPFMAGLDVPYVPAVPVGTTAARSTVPLISGASGAVTGRALSQSPYVPPPLKPTVDLFGNILGGGLTNAAVGGVDRAINYAAGNFTDLAKAFDTLGIEPKTVGAVATGPYAGTAQATEATLSGIPGGKGPLRTANQAMVDQFGNAVDDTAANLNFQATGRSAIPSAGNAGNTAQQELRNWRYDATDPNSFIANQDRLYQPVNAVMTGKMVDPSGYRAALESGASDTALAGLPEVQKGFARAKIQQMLDQLNSDAPPGKMLTWEQGQAIRKNIGDMLGTADFTQSLGKQAVSGLYNGIRGDLQNAADGLGVGDQFRAANAYSTDGYNFIERVLSKAVQTSSEAKDIAPETAADSLLRMPGSDLMELRQRVPKAADAIAAYNLRDMANAKPSVATAPGDTSIGTMLTNLNRLQTEDGGLGYRALYGADPYTAGRVGAMTTVGGQMRNIASNLNTSKTAYANYLLQLLTHAGLAVGAGMVGGEGAAAGTLLTSALAPWATTRGVITNPLIYNALRAQPGPRNVPGLLGGSISDIPTITVRPQPDQQR